MNQHTRHACSFVICTMVFMISLIRPVSAHPHVFVDATATAIFSAERVTGMQLLWKFDSLFTSGVLPGRSSSAGPLKPDEITRLHDHGFQYLRHSAYFVHALQRARSIPLGIARNFFAELDGDRLVYSFFVPFGEPVDIKQGPLTIDFDDESYYVDVEFPDGDKRPVMLRNAPESCTVHAGEDSAHLIPLWGFPPPGATITCG